MRYTLVPVPSEYVLDVMRYVLFHAPDEFAQSSGRDAGRVESLLAALDDLQRSLLLLVAESVEGDDQLRLSDAAAELEEGPQAIGDAVRAINGKALWGREVVGFRPETHVGVHGHRGKVSVLTMRPEIARLVRVTTGAQSAHKE